VYEKDQPAALNVDADRYKLTVTGREAGSIMSSTVSSPETASGPVEPRSQMLY
jgi:hypothetical protein